MSGLASILARVSDRLDKSLAESAAVRSTGFVGPMRPGERGALESMGAFSFATRRASQITDQLSGAGGHVANAVGQASPFGAAGGLASAGGEALMMTGNPYAVAAGSALKFGGELAGSLDKLKQWNAVLHTSNLQFADFSQAMSMVAVDAEIREQRLNMQRGDARAASARELAEARNKLDEQTMGGENLTANLKNKAGAIAAGYAAGTLGDRETGGILGLTGLGWLAEKITGKPKPEDTGGLAVIAEATKKAYESRPARFNDRRGG